MPKRSNKKRPKKKVGKVVELTPLPEDSSNQAQELTSLQAGETKEEIVELIPLHVRPPLKKHPRPAAKGEPRQRRELSVEGSKGPSGPAQRKGKDHVIELTPLEIPEPEEVEEGFSEPIDILKPSEPSTKTEMVASSETPEGVTESTEEGKISEELSRTESVYNVFLAKISAPDKKETVSQMIAEIKGVSIKEARKLTDRLLIPLIKGVTEEAARKYLERFKKIGVVGRYTKTTKNK